MKNISKLSLADLITGLNYFDKLVSDIDNYLTGLNKPNNKSDVDELNERLNFLYKKRADFRKEISKRIKDDTDIFFQNITKQSQAYDRFWALKNQDNARTNIDIQTQIADEIFSASPESVKEMVKKETKKRKQKKT